MKMAAVPIYVVVVFFVVLHFLLFFFLAAVPIYVGFFVCFLAHLSRQAHKVSL